ncbi:MAG: flagellar assembly protein FliW [Nitrospira sp.]|nr:flagellar assembly protein FliW [Nitrospira sp.]MDH4302525.1 flagellar assembly protein FliW [Nitrospira sp.]MDH5192369.1 flagellar assembly protein FliW [Nitrospira sp.]
MKCTSLRFGVFDVSDDSIVRFPVGLLGFPESQRYVILDHDTEAPFKWLQSLDEPGLAFVILDPALFHADYHVNVPADIVAEMNNEKEDDLAVVVILTIPSDDPARMTANLRGPLVISHKTRLGTQLVLSEEYPTRYPLFPVSSSQPSTSVEARPAAKCPA